jgi:hypothetical protein
VFNIFYRGTPDTWILDDPECEVFYYEGEFWLQELETNNTRYFEDTEECLFAMKDIKPWRDWYIENK